MFGDGQQQDYKKLQETLVRSSDPAVKNGHDLVNLIRFKSSKANSSSMWSKNLDLLVEVANKLTGAEKTRFFGGTIPLMKEGVDFAKSTNLVGKFTTNKDHVTFSRQEIFNLLSCCFFCCFPESKGKDKLLNFSTLFEKRDNWKSDSVQKEKIKCLLNYFNLASQYYREDVMKETVNLTRSIVRQDPDWSNSKIPTVSPQLILSGIAVGVPASGMCRVDFANKRIGGGVLATGSLQEEIMFITCPELIIARFFSSEMKDNEAIFVSGLRQYSLHQGYAESFKCTGFLDLRSPESFCHRVVAMDALDFSNQPSWYQYEKHNVDRELRKAYAAFSAVDVMPILSGNWGGGCFQGDPVLKAKIQMLAASEAGKIIHYDCFGKTEIQNAVLLNVNCNRKETVGEEYLSLLEYCKDADAKQKADFGNKQNRNKKRNQNGMLK
ncbi:uncharacterized protein LOC132199303 isoform X2 [Neocloeon triangulifer]|uniref:uncharacterized protein LOC132199303 isoform X2 n=1 Tax=Neocloeon triangulifer TaxID=2078957 RepID=UPI00286FAA5B|nr:uncharacterized protein LOC132199303 isoform X2 [Neocloeon triangulifer]